MTKDAPRTVLKHLRDYNTYLSGFRVNQRSIYFEKLVAETFASILNLPFFSRDDDNASVTHRVTWLGSDSRTTAAPSGEPDAVARAYDFYILIEPTLKSGSIQWSQEFAPSIRHAEDFVKQQRLNPKQVYVVLVPPALHVDTFRSIHRYRSPQLNVLTLEVPYLILILETSILAFSMRHLELRNYFNKVRDCVDSSSTIEIFNEASKRLIADWQADVLKLEKSAFIGVKSYEAMRKIGRKYIGASEILGRLQRHPFVTQYLRMIGESIHPNIIEESLIQQSLASRLSLTPEGEQLFCPVPTVDFRGRQEKLTRAVEGVRG